MQVNWPPHERPALFEQLKSLITEKRNPHSMEIDTDTKPILNMISTAAMIRLGKVYQNKMVDLKFTNRKLVERSRSIVMIATDAHYETVGTALNAADGYVKRLS